MSKTKYFILKNLQNTECREATQLEYENFIGSSMLVQKTEDRQYFCPFCGLTIAEFGPCEKCEHSHRNHETERRFQALQFIRNCLNEDINTIFSTMSPGDARNYALQSPYCIPSHPLEAPPHLVRANDKWNNFIRHGETK